MTGDRNLCGVCCGCYIPNGQTTPCETCLTSGRPLVSAFGREAPSDAEGAILAEQEERGGEW